LDSTERAAFQTERLEFLAEYGDKFIYGVNIGRAWGHRPYFKISAERM